VLPQLPQNFAVPVLGVPQFTQNLCIVSTFPLSAGGMLGTIGGAVAIEDGVLDILSWPSGELLLSLIKFWLLIFEMIIFSFFFLWKTLLFHKTKNMLAKTIAPLKTPIYAPIFEFDPVVSYWVLLLDFCELQSMQKLAPKFEQVLATHGVQTKEVLAPNIVEYVPAEQGEQTEELLAPEIVEYVPAEQGEQIEALLAPTMFEYVPATQGMHDVELLAPEIVE